MTLDYQNYLLANCDTRFVVLTSPEFNRGDLSGRYVKKAVLASIDLSTASVKKVLSFEEKHELKNKYVNRLEQNFPDCIYHSEVDRYGTVTVHGYAITDKSSVGCGMYIFGNQFVR